MRVIPIEHGSAEYEQVRTLRRRFLREPLGLPLSAQDVQGEEAQHHFALATDEGEIIGGLIGKPLSDRTVQIRQVVVHEEHRGLGHGALLMKEAEVLLGRLGFREFVLYAREESAPFYARCGYARTGETKPLLGIPHVRMEKKIG